MIISKAQEGKPSPTISLNLPNLVLDELAAEELSGIVNLVKAKGETGLMSKDCTTPTAEENRIPDIVTCPPAPRKRKVSVPMKGNARKKVRVVKEFFVSPELEAMLGISGVSCKISWSVKICR